MSSAQSTEIKKPINRKEESKKYYEKYKEEIKGKTKKYYHKNIDKCREDHKKWYKQNKNKQKEYYKKKTNLYISWSGMKTRCNNPNTSTYKHYGGKGISVCNEWTDFLSFKNWALNNGYKDGLSLDRKDNKKDYCPSNCKWSTMKEQQNNRTNNHLITYNGHTFTLKQWSEKLNINYPTLLWRIRNKWTIDRVLTPIVHKEGK